ncbi:MAG TPA: UDP-N-acetylglucosamine 2-epimerase [Acetobacteraceae bacterium]|nr:UDP-N-acetylglucosamine 2-epimerase [Acetobacteraceae bacterium]
MAVKDLTRRRLLSIVGTRPEAIKIAPLALAATGRGMIEHELLATGQHDLLFDEAPAGFGLTADHRLAPVARDPLPDVMLERLTHALLSVLPAIDPDLLIVQGDTNSALAGALAASAARTFDRPCRGRPALSRHRVPLARRA